jgi:MFS family permease
MSATASTIEGASGGGSIRQMWSITAGHCLTHWYPATFYLLLPVIGQELGLNYAQIGFIMTCQFAATALFNIPGGLLVDMIGRKGLLMAVSLFWVGVPYAFMGAAHAYWVLVVCVTLVGIGNNLWHPAAISYLGQRFPGRRAFVLSVHGMGGNVGDALAPLAVGALLAVVGWRAIVAINVVPGVIAAVAILILSGALGPDERKRPSGAAAAGGLRGRLAGLAGLMRDRQVLMISIGSAFRTLTQNGLITFLPLYLAHDMGLSSAWIGAAMACVQVCGFIAAPIAGHLADRMGHRRIVAGSMLMSIVVIIAMILAGGTPWFVALVALLGFFLYAVRSIMQAWILDVVPESLAGTSVGLLFGAQSLGSAVGPLACGLIADRWGILSAFWFLAASIVIANVFVFVTPGGKDERRLVGG